MSQSSARTESSSEKAGPLDLRIPSDWGRALSRLPQESRALLEPAHIARFEQGTLLLDTGNSFFNNRIATNRDLLARALSEAVGSTQPLRIETPAPGAGGEGPAAKTFPAPPLVSEAAMLFGSEVIGVRPGKPQTDHRQGDQP